MKYSIDDRMPLIAALMYGFQWWVVTLPCVVVTGAVVAGLHFEGWADRAWYLQKLFAVMGAFTVIQVTLGHRLPLVLGPATVLMVGLSASAGASTGVLYTSIAIGGALVAVLGFTNKLAGLRRFFTARIVSVILILIAFTLTPIILRLIVGGASPGASLAMALMLVLALVALNEGLKGSFKSLTLPLGLVFGTIIYRVWLGSEGDASGAQGGGAVLGWLVEPAFEAGPIVAFLFCFLALIINELGSVEAVGRSLGASGMEGRVRRGVGVTGLGSFFSGLFGVIGPVDFSLSAGLVAATGCAARTAFIPAGLGLIACAFAPGFIAVLVAIPKPVMGAVLLYSMVSQLAGGLSMLVAQKAVATYAQGVITGLPLMAGLAISFTSPEAFAVFPDVLRPILSNGFVMGTLLALFLEHVLLRAGGPSAEKE